MAAQPVGILDYLLAAAQGIGNFLALYRTEDAGTHRSVAEILGNSLAYGTVAGMASLLLTTFIYRRLAARMGGKATGPQVVHVLAYGSVPLAASLGIWLLTALLAGEAAFVDAPRGDLEGFVFLLLQVQFGAYLLLVIWSIVLQVMGFSEIQGFSTRKAFGLWVLGQIAGFLVSLLLALAVETLFPGLLLRFVPQH
jgi:Yip1 domain